MAHRLAIRFDDDVYETFRRWADTVGCSMTAFLQARVELGIELWRRHDWTPPDEWPDGPVKDNVLAVAVRAREIDGRRRRRAP